MHTHIAGTRGTPCTLLKETPKADNPAYHFVVIIFSKHSPGCADKLQTQHSRWALSLALSLFLHFFLGIPFFSIWSVCCHTLSAVAGWRGGGEPEEVERGKQDMAQRREGYDFERALAGDQSAHTLTSKDTNTHTDCSECSCLFQVLLYSCSSQTSTWLYGGRSGSTGEGQHLRGWKGITSNWLSQTELKCVVGINWICLFSCFKQLIDLVIVHCSIIIVIIEIKRKYLIVNTN